MTCLLSWTALNSRHSKIILWARLEHGMQLFKTKEMSTLGFRVHQWSIWIVNLLSIFYMIPYLIVYHSIPWPLVLEISEFVHISNLKPIKISSVFLSHELFNVMEVINNETHSSHKTKPRWIVFETLWRRSSM
mgnify:CR=1 FL=1